jgi:hypothetical protein
MLREFFEFFSASHHVNLRRLLTGSCDARIILTLIIGGEGRLMMETLLSD